MARKKRIGELILYYFAILVGIKFKQLGECYGTI